MNIGLIGFDTSHSVVFPKLLRERANENECYRKIEITLGWPGDPETSVHPESLEKTYAQVKELGIQTVDSLEELAERCDAFLLESVNGDTHLEQAKVVFPTGKPTFIDKPFANTLADAKAIAKLAAETGTPCWSASSLRFEPNTLAAKQAAGPVNGVDVYGPAHYCEKGRGLVYYGIHSAEVIFTLMGSGLGTVQTTWHEDWELVVGTWKDGRVATLRGIRKNSGGFGGVVHGEKSVSFNANGDFYGALSRELAEFFVSGQPPVPLADSVEIIAFLDAAVCSKEQGGKVIEV